MKKTATDPVPFLTWHRQGNEVACLTTQEFKSKILVHLRIYSRGQNGKLYATERGVTIPRDQIRSLRRALRKVQKALEPHKDHASSEKRKSKTTEPE